MNTEIVTHHESHNHHRPNVDAQTQFTVTGKIGTTKVGTEIIKFSFRLGPIQVICIANIPGEGEGEAPAYIKLGLVGSQK